MRRVTLNILMLLVVCQTLSGQICNNPDNTINGILRLQIFDNDTNFSVERFTNTSADSIQLIERSLLPHRCRELMPNMDACAIFVNKDRSELLLASQGHGLIKNQYEAFLLLRVDENLTNSLNLPGIIYTNYEHFRIDNVIGIGTCKEELIRLMGKNYKIGKKGEWIYSYISEAYFEELKILNISIEDNEGGDVSIIFSFEQDKVYYFIWKFDI